MIAAPVPRPGAFASPWLRWAGGLALGALFTWLSARSWPVDELFGGTLALGRDSGGSLALLLRRDGGATALWSVKLWAVGAYLAFLFVIHWLRVLRWRPLLQPYHDVHVIVLNRVGAVGFMAVFLLPLRLGELARPIMLARSTPVGFGTGLGTIALERVLDGLVVTLVLFAALIQVHPDTLQRNPEVQIGAWVALLVFVAALGGLGLALVARKWTLDTTRLVLAPLSPKLADKVVGLVAAFVDGLLALKNPWYFVQFVAMTVAYWGVNGLGVWLLGHGFGVHMPVICAYAMMSCVVVGMMIPNSPGNVGSFWYFMLLPASLYGVRPDSPRTVAFALAVWLLQTVQVTAFGVWGWWSDGRAQARSALVQAQREAMAADDDEGDDEDAVDGETEPDEAVRQ